MIQRTDTPNNMHAPIAAPIVKRARKIADAYDLVLRFEDSEWYGHALEYPEAMGDGKTVESCVRATRKALTLAVAVMLENGQSPPLPASEGQRTAQVNVRLTPEEKALLEVKAKTMGYRGLSDFMRATVLKAG